jgi:hypothetical protein
LFEGTIEKLQKKCVMITGICKISSKKKQTMVSSQTADFKARGQGKQKNAFLQRQIHFGTTLWTGARFSWFPETTRLYD